MRSIFRSARPARHLGARRLPGHFKRLIPRHAHASWVLVTTGSACLLLAHVRATDGTWLNTGITDGSWSTTSNWVGDTIPGTTSGTTNAETATFNTAVGTSGTPGSPVVIDANRNIKNVTFTGAVGNFYIGTIAGNKLYLTSGGTIQIENSLAGTNVIETINAPLEIQNASGGNSGTYTFTNNSVNGTGAGAGTLIFGGSITGVATLGNTTTLTFNGTNANANTVSGMISNGTAGGKLALTKSGTGVLYLTNANTYTGMTTVNGGGILDVGTLTSNAVSSSSGLLLGTSGSSGILQGNGTFTRSLSGNATPGAGQIASQEGGFSARGGQLTVNFGGTTEIALNTSGYVFGNNLILNALTADSKIVLQDNIHLNSTSGRTFTVTAGIGGDAATSAELVGVIKGATLTSGNVQIRKNGTGMLILSNEANTFNGAVQINDGTVSVSKINNINDGNSSLGAPTSAALGTIRLGSSLATGRLHYTGTGDTTDRLIELGGSTGGGIIDQSGSTGLLKFTSNLVSGTGSKTLTLQGSTAGIGEFAGNIGNPVSGSLSLTKKGSGNWRLSGSNTYSGLTNVTDSSVLDVGTIGSGALSGNSGLLLGSSVASSGIYGILQGNGTLTRSLGSNATPTSSEVAGAAGGFAARGGQLTVDFGGELSLNQALFRFGNNFIFGSSTADSRVVLVNSINLNSGAANGTRKFTVVAGIGGADATAAEFQGVISNTNPTTPNGIRKEGDGTLILSASNTYTGPTQIAAGTVQIGNGGGSGSLTSTTANGADGSVTISSGATLAFNRSDSFLFENLVKGSGGVKQIGSGTTTLTAANSYTGTTTVSGGTLLINGNQSAAPGDIAVAVGATLGGNGTLGGATSVSGTLSVGADTALGTTGTLAFSGKNLTFEPGSTWLVDIAQGVASDSLTNIGVLSLNGTLSLDLRDFANAYVPGQSYTLATYGSASGLPSLSVLQDADGDGFFDAGGGTYQLIISSNSLTLSAVPEPAAFLPALAVLSLGWFARRRRR